MAESVSITTPEKIAPVFDPELKRQVAILLRRIEGLTDTLWQALNPEEPVPLTSAREVLDIIQETAQDGLELLGEETLLAQERLHREDNGLVILS